MYKVVQSPEQDNVLLLIKNTIDDLETPINQNTVHGVSNSIIYVQDTIHLDHEKYIKNT